MINGSLCAFNSLGKEEEESHGGRSPKKSIQIDRKEQSVQFNLFKTEYLLVDLTRVTVAGYG